MRRLLGRKLPLLRPYTHILAPSFSTTRRKRERHPKHTPLLRRLTASQVPVILVGNKIDLRGGEVTNEALEDEIIPIMNEFKVRSSSSYSAQQLTDLARKWKHVLNVRPRCLSTCPKSSISRKRQSFIPPHRYTTPEIMYAFPCLSFWILTQNLGLETGLCKGTQEDIQTM